jgi:acyl carrier protein
MQRKVTMISNASILDDLKSVLVTTLGIEDRASSIEASTPLFGGLPELDSLAVLELVTAIEDEFDITIDDEEFSGDIFETLGSLASFVGSKHGSGS